MGAVFGLIGYPLGHSFSQKYYSDKFEKEGLKNYSYKLFELENIDSVRTLTSEYPNLKGLNVTIPHKTKIIKYLDTIDPIAKAINAVNCISIINDKWIGYNTDGPAFKLSLTNWLSELDKKEISTALIFGNGGASKAVQWALNSLGIRFKIIDRQENSANLKYKDLTKEILQSANLLINTTPVGMYPNDKEELNINLEHLQKEQLLYDLIYNPAKTLFLEAGIRNGCQTKNGLEMLHLQAEMAWDIWNQSINIHDKNTYKA